MLTWLNLNGGYILAFKYIDDSLQQHPDNQLALQGADIAYQHSYMEKSLAFLSHFKPQNERDSIELWFLQLRVCASKIYTLTDEEVYLNINRHLNFIRSDEHLNFQYISDLGRHYHNHGTYDSAVKYDQMACQIAHDRGYSHEDIAMTCQRLGNDYNDMVRKNLVKESERKATYDKAEAKYLECLSELSQVKPTQREKIANCYFTYNFLIRVGWYNPDTLTYYKKALDCLIPNYNSRKKNDPLFCLDPTLASITFTHLGESYYIDNLRTKSIDNAHQCIKYSEDCLELFDQMMMEPGKGGAFLDMIETYSQRNASQLIDYYQAIYPNDTNLAYKLLYLSNASKYPLLNKNHYLNRPNGGQQQKAIELISQINSLNFVAFSTGNKALNDLSVRLLFVADSISPKAHFVVPPITPESVDKIKKLCKNEQAIIVDFSMSYHNLLITFIDKDTISTSYLSVNETPLAQNNAELLNQLMQKNDIVSYRERAFKLYDLVLGSRIDIRKYKKLIIIPCPWLDKISFDALVINNDKKGTWSELNYLGNNLTIQTIPSIQWLFQSAPKPSNFKLSYIQTDFTGSKKLPYNNDLKMHLRKVYNAEILTDSQLQTRTTTQEDILHIASHTEKDQVGYIGLLLQSSKINPKHEGLRYCRMVVLNACETNDGMSSLNEGKISLTRLFLSNGADAVITSIGKVDNHASAELFKVFYKYLSEGKSVSESLSLAKREIRNRTPEWANPYYWSLYELIGNDLSFR